MAIRKCSRCQLELILEKDFPRDKVLPSGFKSVCKQCTQHDDKARYLKNKEIIKVRARQWYAENKIRAAKTKQKLLQTNVNAKLADNLRSRLKTVLRGKSKVGSAVQDLGCSLEELKTYIEAKFYKSNIGSEMTWSNYGRLGWHIDHIKPLALFDLTDLDQLKQACHYTNLQPMWAEENWTKGKKYGS